MADDFAKDAEYQALLDQERKRLASGGSPQLLAHKVKTLGKIVVTVAYVVGALGVVVGLITMLGGASAGSRSGGGAVAGGVLAGLVIVAVSLVQAAFIALIGRYAQMRAATVLARD